MDDDDDDFSNFEDDELDSLYEKNINKNVQEITFRRSVAVQRDLMNNILPGEKPIYEEIQRKVTFGPTHHKFNEESLSTYLYPTNFEVRDYQFDIVKKSLFTNILCAIPTGMGKTFIASTVMLNYFLWTQTGKIIFTAPTRPLVAQQIKACLGITGIPSDETAILLDKSRKNREEIWANKRVFFTTPQVVENDLKRGVLNPKDIVCLVIDEAHRATGSYAYTNVVKFIDRFNSSYRILALTATPGSDLDSVQEVVNNLDISKIEIRTEESIDIVKYMKQREKVKIQTGLTTEIEDVIEQLGIAIQPVLQQAVELGIYEECEPSRINSFKAMQLSQKIIANPTLPEGIKWRNFFILQLLNHVGQMLKRIKIYGLRTFYNYFINKHKEFTTKYNLGKSTNKIAAGFYFHPILKTLRENCDKHVANPKFLGHEKLQNIRDELIDFFENGAPDSRVIIFTELRESALEIVKCVDSMNDKRIRPHIFIGQARGKEGFDEVTYSRKHKPKGRKKEDKLRRQEEERRIEEQRKLEKEQQKLERSVSRTGSSEDAQINGMNQKRQKETIKEFKEGIYNVLVCTSIGEEGLDIGEVDLIICYDTTSSPIKNIQRMGRTGRKRDGKIILLFSSNEATKFEQAMENYSNLQKLITKNFIEYKKSDRILPTSINPECVKKFIEINESDKEVNNMESDEIIKYATQRMMGKTPKKKTTKSRKVSKEPKSKQKQFFMPDNVVTGIIKASTLVNKYNTDENGNKVRQEIKAKPVEKKKLATLDSIENDPSSSDLEDFDLQDYGTLKHDQKTLVDILGTVKEETQAQVLPNDNYSGSMENSMVLPVKREKREKDVPQTIGKLDSRSGDSRVSSAKPLATEEVRLPIEDMSYFAKHYSKQDSISINSIPNLSEANKASLIPHTSFTQGIIGLFRDMRENKPEQNIEFNRIKCIGKGLQNGVLKQKNILARALWIITISVTFKNCRCRQCTKIHRN
ncbi:3'-5' DNA helicase NDAI_0B01020 [Naumovozyma dairenensis CBS 421]|uniref:ATP-dependent DNA helicase n=1 Tax=Naumovozyma dairenensis (strain ATCC 10597 / BCRC 20456 / CBS 421 / NBRC 0211 / NRRL Y-12639) TaxID=1071378 RepID=G0W5S5_NAUDC|nr:hypothetical protein NDAI_0B01020 [Naumovozyma dairenensis CBS 421]CCD23136.1 hypothetical protein NDAI_0B01020 [Naumovozyma dairenensis CBS 421]